MESPSPSSSRHARHNLPHEGAQGTQPVYEFRSVTKIYPPRVRANENVFLSLHAGEILGLLGPNGAGKSTLVRQMVGLTSPTSGQIRYRGVALPEARRRVAREVAYLPQHPLALYDLTVEEAIALTGRLRGLSPSRAAKEAALLMDLFSMGDLRRRVVARLSGGEHRLAGLMSALVGDPATLILDEPTNELDPRMRRAVWAHLQRLKAEGRTILLVTHNVAEAESAVDRVAVMRKGEILAEGHPGDLRRLGLTMREIRLAFRQPQEASFWRGIFPDMPTRALAYRQHVEEGALPALLRTLSAPEYVREVDSLELAAPSLETVYLALQERPE